MPIEPPVVTDTGDAVLVLSKQLLEARSESRLITDATTLFRVWQTHSSAAALSVGG